MRRLGNLDGDGISSGHGVGDEDVTVSEVCPMFGQYGSIAYETLHVARQRYGAYVDGDLLPKDRIDEHESAGSIEHLLA